jgi:hypothetical protein
MLVVEHTQVVASYYLVAETHQTNNEQAPTKLTTLDAQAISKFPHVGNT